MFCLIQTTALAKTKIKHLLIIPDKLKSINIGSGGQHRQTLYLSAQLRLSCKISAIRKSKATMNSEEILLINQTSLTKSKVIMANTITTTIICCVKLLSLMKKK